MAVRQRAPAASPDTEVERVAKLLEEYAERWRALEGHQRVAWGDYAYTREPRGMVALYILPEGASIVLRDRGGRRELRIVPPDDARKVAEELVRLERRYGLLTYLLDAVGSGGPILHLMVLEGLRRYAPLFGKDYGVPELRWTGDVYRDLLETIYATCLYSAVGRRAWGDAALRWPPRRGDVGAVVLVPVEPPIPLTYGGRGARGITTVEVRVRALGLGSTRPYLALRDGTGAAVYEVEPRYDEESGSYCLSVLHASLLMSLERERGVLTKLSEAVEEGAKALERALEEALLAAEAGALLFA